MISDCASEPLFIHSASLFKTLISSEPRVIESLTQQICLKMLIHSQTKCDWDITSNILSTI